MAVARVTRSLLIRSWLCSSAQASGAQRRYQFLVQQLDEARPLRVGGAADDVDLPIGGVRVAPECGCVGHHLSEYQALIWFSKKVCVAL